VESLKEKKLILDYPCKWSYKLIGKDKNKITKDVKDILQDKEHSIKLSKSSKKGKFISLELSLIVVDEEERLKIFQNLGEKSSILYII
jgi:putative lipoic acid-binding regulatory protein